MKPLKKLSAKVTAAMLSAGMVLSSVTPVYASELTSVVQESQQSKVSVLSELPQSEVQETPETDLPAEPPTESTEPSTPPTTEENPGQESSSENTDPTPPEEPDDQPPTDNPDTPEENTPSEPTDPPSPPTEDTLSDPAEDTPSEPAEDTPSDPAEDTPSEPTEDTPPESEDGEATDTDTEQPEEEPTEDTSVLDTAWLNHIDYGKYFFNAVDMRKGFAQIDKVYAYAKVSDYLHVREKADEHSRIVGKLSANALCYVIADSDKEWVYIESGDVRGFVKSRYLQQGEEALSYVTQTGEENMEMAELLIQPEDNKAFTYSTDTVYEVKHGTGEGVIRFADQFLGNPYI